MSPQKNFGKKIFLMLLAIPLLAGCGRTGAPKADAHAFDNAPQAVKQMWTDAAVAAKANDYVTAQTTLRFLAAQDLTEAQRTLVDNTIYDLSERLTAAVKKGDPAAIKALGELRRSSASRPPAK
jgi:hypothetical protein